MIAVIGAGYWGKNLVRVYSEMGKLSVICDKEDVLPGQYPDVKRCTSIEDALKQDEVKAVVIATPAETHYELARKALIYGKHVYIEKPMVLYQNQAQELINLAEGYNLVLMVGHLMQYHPAFIMLKRMVASGDLGTIRHITSQRLNSGKVRTTENSLWSFAPHDISMILALTGEEPNMVNAVGANHLRGDISDITTTHMAFPSGIQASVFVSWLHPYKVQRLIVIGSAATVVLDDTKPWGSKLTVYEGTNAPYPIEMAPTEPLRAECEHFIGCIENKTTPKTDGNEGLRVLRVLQRAQNSMDGDKEEEKVPWNAKRPFDQFTVAALNHESRQKMERRRAFAETTGQWVEPLVDPTAVIDPGAEIGSGTKIWHWTHILPGVKIGKNCTIGQGCMIGPDVTIGDNCKIQNNVSVYKGVTLEDGVFVGPSVVFTNVRYPIADRSDGKILLMEKTLVKKGAAIGANATILCGNVIGEGALIAAGAIVTKDVLPGGQIIGVTCTHNTQDAAGFAVMDVR